MIAEDLQNLILLLKEKIKISIKLPFDCGLTSFSLYIDTSSFARHNLIIDYEDLILWVQITHYRATLVMSELTLINIGIAFKKENSRSIGIVCCVSFKIAILNVESVLW